jgi:hypothetical protein
MLENFKCVNMTQVASLWKSNKYVIGVSEWLLFYANSAIFQLYHGENKLILNDMIMRSALY